MRSGLLLMMMAITFLVASEHAQAVDSTRDLVNECQSLERGKRGTGHRIRIPKTKTALLCWGYMKGMQDLSVWTDQNGHRIMGSCPPAKTTLLQLIHSFVKYAGSHRRQLRGSNTAAAVMTAFQEAFPCNGAVTPPDDDDGIPYSPT
jgi:Ssp1 endopeptidase immunity protein Rap1a